MTPVALAAALALAAPAASSAPPGPAWSTRTVGGDTVASLVGGDGVGITVLCRIENGPKYGLIVTGPANGLKPQRSVKGRVEGRRRVPLRFHRATVDARGMARLVTFGGTRGGIGDQSGALEAVEAIRTARGPIRVVAGGLNISAPATGVERAMAPLVRRCGPLKPLIKRAEAREGEIP